MKVPPVSVKPVDGVVTFEVNIELPSGWKANPLESPPTTLILLKQQVLSIAPVFDGQIGEKRQLLGKLPCRLQSEGDDEIQVSTNYFRCQTADEGVCKIGEVVFQIPLKVTNSGKPR